MYIYMFIYIYIYIYVCIYIYIYTLHVVLGPVPEAQVERLHAAGLLLDRSPGGEKHLLAKPLSVLFVYIVLCMIAWFHYTQI